MRLVPCQAIVQVEHIGVGGQGAAEVDRHGEGRIAVACAVADIPVGGRGGGGADVAHGVDQLDLLGDRIARLREVGRPGKTRVGITDAVAGHVVVGPAVLGEVGIGLAGRAEEVRFAAAGGDGQACLVERGRIFHFTMTPAPSFAGLRRSPIQPVHQ